jgi:hypothetical protein
MMNWKEVVVVCCKILHQNLPTGTEKALAIAGSLAEVRTRDLSHTVTAAFIASATAFLHPANIELK